MKLLEFVIQELKSKYFASEHKEEQMIEVLKESMEKDIEEEGNIKRTTSPPALMWSFLALRGRRR